MNAVTKQIHETPIEENRGDNLTKSKKSFHSELSLRRGNSAQIFPAVTEIASYEKNKSVPEFLMKFLMILSRVWIFSSWNKAVRARFPDCWDYTKATVV